MCCVKHGFGLDGRDGAYPARTSSEWSSEQVPIDHRSDRPVCHQIADELRDRILSGAFAPGQKLP